MILPPPVRHALLEVAMRLKDPDRECSTADVGAMILDAAGECDAVRCEAILNTLRLALGLSPVPGSLARWARGKSRDEVAQALERVATSDAMERQ